MKKTICLGLESSAHTFGCAIVDDNCNILADERKSFTTTEGGMKPSDVADHHHEHAVLIVKKALESANLKMNDIDVVAFSQGPGLGPCLRVSAIIARTLALAHKKPLVGVNHAVGHIELGKKLTGAKDPLVVYVSGGNSQILVLEKGRYRVLGETLDTGVGNLFDSFGRKLGMGFPAGPKIDEMYFLGKKYIDLPYSVKGMDLQFSGLLTAAEKKIGSCDKNDLAFSLMHTANAMLAEVAERALAFTGKKEVLLTGGVACSKSLQKVFGEMCEEQGARLCVCPCRHAIDNGVQIAWTGMLQFLAGEKTEIRNSGIIQKYRSDSVKVSWAK